MCVKVSIYKAGKRHFLLGGDGTVMDCLLVDWALPLCVTTWSSSPDLRESSVTVLLMQDITAHWPPVTIKSLLSLLFWSFQGPPFMPSLERPLYLWLYRH